MEGSCIDKQGAMSLPSSATATPHADNNGAIVSWKFPARRTSEIGMETKEMPGFRIRGKSEGCKAGSGDWARQVLCIGCVGWPRIMDFSQAIEVDESSGRGGFCGEFKPAGYGRRTIRLAGIKKE
jgi:hypothetical protein